MVYITQQRNTNSGSYYLILTEQYTIVNPKTGLREGRKKYHGYIGLASEYPHLAATVGLREHRDWDDPLIMEAMAIIEQRRKNKSDASQSVPAVA